MNIDYFMNEAISEAKKALNSNEVPVGGLIVENKSQKILSRGHNLTNKLNSAINHCEILLINQACKKLNSKHEKNQQNSKTNLYTINGTQITAQKNKI